MARDIADILKELDAGYDPGRKLIQAKLNEAPALFDAQNAGLKAQEQDYFDNTIMAGARNRGMGFSGIPEGERARYGASTYMPAVAKLKSSQNDYTFGMIDALNGINLDQRTKAQEIRQQELTREQQQAQWQAEMAAQERARASSGGGGGFSPSIGDLGISTAPAAPQLPAMPQKPALGLPPGATRVPTKLVFSAPLGRKVWVDQAGNQMTPAEVLKYENEKVKQQQKASNRNIVAKASPMYYVAKPASKAISGISNFLRNNF